MSLPISSSYGWYGSIGGSTSESVSPERVTFLAPKSQVLRFSGTLWNGDIKPLPSTSVQTSLFAPSGHKILGKQIEYTESTSPIRFRNFVTYSLTENFADESYIDNGFYVSKIVEVKPNDVSSTSVGPLSVFQPVHGSISGGDTGIDALRTGSI